MLSWGEHEKHILTSRPLYMQYVQYERKESIFESLTDLNLITLILKSLFFSLLRFPTWEFIHLFNSNEEMRSHAQQIWAWKNVIAADPELAPCILISPVVNLGKVYGLVLRF